MQERKGSGRKTKVNFVYLIIEPIHISISERYYFGEAICSKFIGLLQDAVSRTKRKGL